MSEKAKALGIHEAHLYRAMVLVRNLRVQALKDGLDPRATRIALIYANLVDRYYAEKKLSHEDLRALDEIALELFNKMRTGLDLP